MPSRTGRSLLDVVVRRAEKAWNELELSVVTRADKERLARVLSALRALDDEQAKLKSTIAWLFDENADQGSLTFTQIREALAEEGVSFATLRERVDVVGAAAGHRSSRDAAKQYGSSSKLPRGVCPRCGNEVALRKGNLVREHRVVPTDARPCRGSGKPAVSR